MPVPMDFRQMVEAARRNVEEVSAAEAKQALDDGEVALLLDVREPNEWAGGHIPGALHVPIGGVGLAAEAGSARANPELVGRKAERIVVYCAHGNRSLLAADALKKMGYANVASMAGGIVGWAAQRYPVE